MNSLWIHFVNNISGKTCQSFFEKLKGFGAKDEELFQKALEEIKKLFDEFGCPSKSS